MKSIVRYILLPAAVLLPSFPVAGTDRPVPAARPSYQQRPEPNQLSVSYESRELLAMLPMLDAFLSSDEQFARELAVNLSISQRQLSRLRVLAQQQAARLRAVHNLSAERHYEMTFEIGESSWRQMAYVIGAEKTRRMLEFVLHRWQAGPPDLSANTAILASR